MESEPEFRGNDGLFLLFRLRRKEKVQAVAAGDYKEMLKEGSAVVRRRLGTDQRVMMTQRWYPKIANASPFIELI